MGDACVFDVSCAVEGKVDNLVGGAVDPSLRDQL